MPARSDLTISKRTVDALSVEGREAVFWDRDLPGFGVRVYPSGRKVYVVQSRGPKGPRRATLGRHGEVLAEQARRTAAEVIDRIKQGEDPFPPPPEPELTVAVLAERYMEAHVSANCNAHTAGIYRGSLDNHILPALGAMPVSSVGRSEVSALHYGLRHTPRAANRALMVLSKMFSLAEAWGLAPGGEQPLPLRGQVQGRKARAVPDPGGVPAGGKGAVQTGGGGRVSCPRGGGAAPVDADGVPSQRDPDPALGRRGPERRGVAPP